MRIRNILFDSCPQLPMHSPYLVTRILCPAPIKTFLATCDFVAAPRSGRVPPGDCLVLPSARRRLPHATLCGGGVRYIRAWRPAPPAPVFEQFCCRHAIEP